MFRSQKKSYFFMTISKKATKVAVATLLLKIHVLSSALAVAALIVFKDPALVSIITLGNIFYPINNCSYITTIYILCIKLKVNFLPFFRLLPFLKAVAIDFLCYFIGRNIA